MRRLLRRALRDSATRWFALAVAVALAGTNIAVAFSITPAAEGTSSAGFAVFLIFGAISEVVTWVMFVLIFHWLRHGAKGF
jgi:predicted permease